MLWLVFIEFQDFNLSILERNKSNYYFIFEYYYTYAAWAERNIFIMRIKDYEYFKAWIIANILKYKSIFIVLNHMKLLLLVR